MTNVARHRPLRALLLGLALFAAACAGSDDTVSTEAADSTDDASAEATPAADADADTEASDDDTASTDDDHSGDDGAMAEEDTDESAPADPADGEETAAPASGPPPSLPPEEAQAAAEQNIPNLQAADDVRNVEVVSVYDGSVTSLQEVVTGDRPVLLWFWAPH